ncbi:hypothetical protein AVT10_10045 [Sphingomonas hankookensis]|uniref:Uncharacterized protein n=1 Tax=Sphingomonas hankookensis TaxID=563996 RepID=A0ABR5YEU9_9SPHN|nr:hypothetical protein AVT10_10045 [Sphingomonas hankookensis]PZT96554.1 MAG: hypothetical protein DI625_01325 [Sphingomonas sp.]RSV30173.1 hypothetical protein CA237_07960 [Sphingomonas sp. ABOLH]
MAPDSAAARRSRFIGLAPWFGGVTGMYLSGFALVRLRFQVVGGRLVSVPVFVTPDLIRGPAFSPTWQKKRDPGSSPGVTLEAGRAGRYRECPAFAGMVSLKTIVAA